MFLIAGLQCPKLCKWYQGYSLRYMKDQFCTNQTKLEEHYYEFLHAITLVAKKKKENHTVDKEA